MRALKIFTAIYIVLSILSLLLIPISAYGVFGAEPDPLSAIFALLLSIPWIFILKVIGGGASGGIAVAAFGMALNAAILLFIIRRRSRANPE